MAEQGATCAVLGVTLLERAASLHHSSVSLNLSAFLQSVPHSLQRLFIFVSPKTQSMQALN